MVTGSKVGDVFQCLRRAVLLQRVSSGSLSREAKYGTMAHELFADSLREALAVGASAAAKDAAVRSLIARHAEELWALKQTDEMAMQMMMAYVQPSQEWVGQFVQPHVAGGSARRSWAGGAIQRAKGSEPMSMSVTCVVDIEESISSAKWGVKGNIDAVVQVPRAARHLPRNRSASESAAHMRREEGHSWRRPAIGARCALHALAAGCDVQVELEDPSASESSYRSTPRRSLARSKSLTCPSDDLSASPAPQRAAHTRSPAWSSRSIPRVGCTSYIVCVVASERLASQQLLAASKLVVPTSATTSAESCRRGSNSSCRSS